MNELNGLEPHIMIIESRFYTEVSDELAKGAIQVLSESGFTYERVQVPGALEIPSVIRYAIKSMQLFCGDDRFDGFITLGCVIRGETGHYDQVCNESMRGVQDVALEYALAIGNGILTVENMEQAMKRAKVSEGNKGGVAAQTCIDMIKVKNRFGLIRK